MAGQALCNEGYYSGSDESLREFPFYIFTLSHDRGHYSHEKYFNLSSFANYGGGRKEKILMSPIRLSGCHVYDLQNLYRLL